MKYMIHCCPGTGGLFLTSVLAKTLGYNMPSRFSATGNAHDLGQGNWKGTNGVCIVGDFWDINYRLDAGIYYTHVFPENFVIPQDCKLILITVDPMDYRKVTELYVKKAWPDLWTQEEYNKWAGPDYPPYSADNIQTSELIVNDLINDLEHTVVASWLQRNADISADYTIDFRTIMGINDRDLVDDICSIVNRTTTHSIRQYVQEYQQLNRKMYFENYA